MSPGNDWTRLARPFSWKLNATVGLILVCLGSLSGCASHPLRPVQPTLSEDMRSHLGTVGITGTDTIPEVRFVLPAKGWLGGLGRGTVKGAETSIRTGFEIATSGGGAGRGVGEALSIALGIVLAPAAAVVGGTYGAIAAEPAAHVEEADRTLREAIVELKIQETLREWTLRVGRSETDVPFADLSEAPTPPVGTLGNSQLLESIPGDSLLIIQVTSLSLEDGQWSINPSLRLLVKAQAQVVRKSDGNTLYSSDLAYQGEHHTFTEWATGKGDLFRSELDRAYQQLAEQIIDETFLFYPLPGWSTR